MSYVFLYTYAQIYYCCVSSTKYRFTCIHRIVHILLLLVLVTEKVLSSSTKKKRREGDRVKAKVDGWSKYFSGEITKVNYDGTYDMKFDDGERKRGVKETQIEVVVGHSCLIHPYLHQIILDTHL